MDRETRNIALNQDATPRQTRPTMRDVARVAGVSPATVSNVLNGRQSVDPEIVKRVRQAVADLGYRVDAMAANLRRSQRKLIGLIVPDFRNPFFGELVDGIERLAEANGYRLVAVSSREDGETEVAEIRTLADWRIAGLIIVPAGGTFAAGPVIAEVGLTTVVVDRSDIGLDFDSVAVNNREVAYEAMGLLLSRGHRRIVLAASRPDVPNMRERVDGALSAARDAGVTDGVDVVYCGWSLDEAREKITPVLTGASAPTAVFTLFTTTTLAVLDVARRAGLKLPDDVSLFGFDDYAWMQVANPPIATVAQPVSALAEVAWQRLQSRMGGDSGPAQTIRVNCSIEIRESIGPPRADGAHRGGAT